MNQPGHGDSPMPCRSCSQRANWAPEGAQNQYREFGNPASFRLIQSDFQVPLLALKQVHAKIVFDFETVGPDASVTPQSIQSISIS